MRNLKNILYSATGLVNYIRRDCIIDYLDIIHSKNINIQKKRSFDYIMENGNKFEEIIINNIKDKMKKENQLNRLYEIKEKNFNLRFKETVEILTNKKYDIIIGALLINYENNTYGYPDLIVSGNWLYKYIDEKFVNIINDRSKYYIIDIKSSTINMISNGEQISTGVLYDGYKLQIFIYMKALENILKINGINNSTNYGFIMGKKYSFISNKNKIIINDPFEKLGIIEFTEKNSKEEIDFENELKNALLWKKDLEQNYKIFSLNPINKDELYPNMKNKYDKGYKKVKEEIAFNNKEITCLYNCGIKNRKIAWENGIKNYYNKKLNSDLLGFKLNSKKGLMVDKMLDLLHCKKSNITLKKNNNVMEWQKELKYEFYVDFETYNDSWDEFNCDELNSGNQIIYMIGVGILIKNKIVFKCFIIKYFSFNLLKNSLNEQTKVSNLKCKKKDYIYCDNEEDLLMKYVKYINSFIEIDDKKINNVNFYNNCRLIHWSHAEPVLFNKKIKYYNLSNEMLKLPWYDLLLIFKDNNTPILFKENFSFGLKNVIKKLNEFHEIELNWNELDDGLLSSFIAKDIFNNKEKDMNKEMIEIVEYNYIDCLALYKIITWMRDYIKN